MVVVVVVEEVHRLGATREVGLAMKQNVDFQEDSEKIIVSFPDVTCINVKDAIYWNGQWWEAHMVCNLQSRYQKLIPKSPPKRGGPHG